jgi:hypothetical protein
MVRNYPDKSHIAFVLLEGETDGKAYDSYANHDACQFIIAHGKKTVIDALLFVDQAGIPGVLGIVDADFDVLEGISYSTNNLLFTDTHDLETMIIKSGALEKILVECGSEEKIARFIVKSGKDIRACLVEHGMHIGYLRWISQRENLALSFEGLEFEKFVDKETLRIDLMKLIHVVKERSYNNHQDKAQKHVIRECDPQKSVEQIKSDAHDGWHICCGHDLVNMLSLGLTRTLGTHNTRSVEPEMIEKLLRLAYEYSHFRQTHLYASIRIWEETNAPFVILRAE